MVILCLINRDVHQYIGHSLIPLDPLLIVQLGLYDKGRLDRGDIVLFQDIQGCSTRRTVRRTYRWTEKKLKVLYLNLYFSPIFKFVIPIDCRYHTRHINLKIICYNNSCNNWVKIRKCSNSIIVTRKSVRPFSTYLLLYNIIIIVFRNNDYTIL